MDQSDTETRLVSGESAAAPRRESARARLESLYDAVGRERDAGAAVIGAQAMSYPVAVVPRHRARVRRTSVKRHAAFITRLRSLIAFVRTHGPEADERTLDHPARLDGISTRVVIATCTACRGKCCGNGGDHAFLRTRTIRDFMSANAALTDDEVIAAYVRHLPERAMHPGCVFQSTTGCTLPREMRSAICNAYLCVGLQRAIDAAVEGETRGVFVAHRDGGTVTRGRFRELPVLGAP